MYQKKRRLRKFPAACLLFILYAAAIGCPPPAPATGGNVFFHVTYDGNGHTHGTVPVDPRDYRAGQSVLLLGNSGKLMKLHVADDAFRFIGWNTQPDGNGTDYGALFTMGAADVTIYAKWLHYSIGNTGPGGGLVFCDTQGYDVKGWRYLEAASVDQSLNIVWGGSGTTVGTTSTAMGEGNQNTLEIVATLGTGSAYAARLCAELESGGYDDWFLPSKTELHAMNEKLAAEGLGDFAHNYYWSSSEEDDTKAWTQLFPEVTQSTRAKSSGGLVRAARVF